MTLMGICCWHTINHLDSLMIFPNDHWKLLQKIAAEHSNHKYPDKPLTHNPHFDKRKMKYFNSYPAWWQTNYEPNFSCQFERRIGWPNGNGDGPKTA